MNVIAQISCYFQHNVVTLKLCNEYLNIWYFILTLDKKTEQFDIQNAILRQHIRELQTSKNSPVFMAHPVVVTSRLRLCWITWYLHSCGWIVIGTHMSDTRKIGEYLSICRHLDRHVCVYRLVTTVSECALSCCSISSASPVSLCCCYSTALSCCRRSCRRSWCSGSAVSLFRCSASLWWETRWTDTSRRWLRERTRRPSLNR